MWRGRCAFTKQGKGAATVLLNQEFAPRGDSCRVRRGAGGVSYPSQVMLINEGKAVGQVPTAPRFAPQRPETSYGV